LPNSNSLPDGAAKPSSDSESRHTPAEASAPTSASLPAEHTAADESDHPPKADGGGPSGQHPHVFHLAKLSADVFEGGTLQGATEENWKILSKQQGSVYLARLEPGGVREPHWHPSGWELNYVISGKIRWSFVGPKATHDTFEAGQGDLVFAPQGHFHYFENASDTEDLVVLIVFNTSAGEPDDDVGIVASLSAIPPDVLAAVFKTSPENFANIPHKIERVTIIKKPIP
jgi:oxalate decarboxylase